MNVDHSAHISLQQRRRPRFYVAGVLVLLMALLSACQAELTPRTTVDSLRILAIQAEPPELSPGDGSIISALIADPLGQDRPLDWFMTLCTPDEVRGGCLEYNELLEEYPDADEAEVEYARCCVRGGTATPVGGVVEVGGGITNRLTTAESMLEGLDETSARQGVNAQITLIVCVSGVCVPEETSPDDAAPTDVAIELPADQSSLAIKRIRVASPDGSPRNANPTLEGLIVAGETFAEGTPLAVSPNTPYTLQPVVSADSIECYASVKSDGSEEYTFESPYFSWYATGGEFDEYFSEPDYITDCSDETPLEERMKEAANFWTSPALDPNLAIEQRLYLVMWDRRGGISWLLMDVGIGGE